VAEMKHKFDLLSEAWYAVALTGYYCESGNEVSHYVFTVIKVYGSFSELDKVDVEGFSILERIFVKKDRLKRFLTSGHGAILGAVTEHSTPVSVAGINYVDKLAEYSKDGTIIKSGSMIQVLMIKKSGAVVYLNELGEVAETRDKEYLVDCLLNSRVVALYCRSVRPLEFENRVAFVFNRILSSYSDYVLRNARDSFLRSDCSKTDVRIGRGLVLEVTASGLSGNGCGVNKYGDWVSAVLVSADDLRNTNNSVLDMEDCVHLSRFELDCGSANAFPHLSIIFPKGISKLSVDRFWINTGKLRLLNLPKNISYGDVSITGARIAGHTGDFNTNRLSLLGTSGLSDVSLHQLRMDRAVEVDVSGCSDLRRVSLYFDLDERDYKFFSLKIARCVELEELLIEINKQEPLELAFFCGTHLLSMTGTPKLSSLTIRCDAGFRFSPIEGWEFLDFSRCFPRLREFRLIGEFSSESAGGKIIVPRGCKVSGWELDIEGA
jgi:hypothetical protein